MKNDIINMYLGIQGKAKNQSKKGQSVRFLSNLQLLNVELMLSFSDNSTYAIILHKSLLVKEASVQRKLENVMRTENLR